jgi:hypothetical protein
MLARDPASAGARFRLLETIRAFAAGRLAADGDEATIRRRHAEAFLHLALEAKRAEGTAAYPAWIDRLSADEANLRSALAWATEAGEAELAMRLVAAVWRFWQVDGHLTEGRRLTGAVLEMPGAMTRSVARMWAIAAAGNISYWQADVVTARARYEEQLELARALDDERGIADALFNLGHVLFIDRSDPADQQATLDEVRQRYRDLGDERGLARVRWAEATTLAAGHPTEAMPIFEESLARFAALGDAQYHAMTAGSMAWASFATGDLMAAVRWAVQALRETYAQRDLGTTAISLHMGVLIAVYAGHADQGALVAGAFDAAGERFGIRPPAGLARFVKTQDPFQLVRDALSPEEFEVAYAEGRRLSLGEAVDLVTKIATEVQPDQ